MDDLETCSWCTTEVPDSELRSIKEEGDGARICKRCQSDYLTEHIGELITFVR